MSDGDLADIYFRVHPDAFTRLQEAMRANDRGQLLRCSAHLAGFAAGYASRGTKSRQGTGAATPQVPSKQQR